MVINKAQFAPKNIRAYLKCVQQLAVPSSRGLSPTSDQEKTLETLLHGKMELEGLMPWSSNYTFLVNLLDSDDAHCLAIYKPGDGERPLWDFPDRTLSHREFASYLISQILGWPNIPATILRDGPHGLGSVQHFIEAEYEAHYFNMRETPAFTESFRQMALFDYIVNNADRKGGHCLKGKNGVIWAIDHGLTFHTEPKLRTVIWEFCDAPIPETLLEDLAHLLNLLESDGELSRILENLITPREIAAFQRRVGRLVSAGQFPALRSGRNVPFPPV